MKILNLSFRNINSLKGDFDIDFQKSPLGDSGIFVITGPTGAGKTSILDAISVALYGKTSRLSTKTKLEQIMTNHTGECRAEVSFSINGKTYRSFYERFRARRKPGGNFQDPKMELVDVEADTIIASKVSMVPKMVEEITGLDYERFSKSIMLAQGNFMAFLSSAEDERAVLLEKMTGSEIYTEISKAAYLRAKEEKNRLDKLNTILENFNLLPEEFLFGKQERLAAIDALIKGIDEELKKISEEKKYLQDIEIYKSAIVGCDEKIKVLDDEENKLMPDFERLEKSLKTIPLKEPYAVLNSFRDQFKTLKKKIIEAEKGITLFAGEFEKTHTIQTKKTGEFDTFKIEKEKTRDLITEIVKKDGFIEKENITLNAQVKTLEGFNQNLNNLGSEKKKTKKNIDKTEREIAACREYLLDNQVDKDLLKDLSLLKEKASGLESVSFKKKEKEDEIKKCRAEYKKAETTLKKTQDILKQTEVQLAKELSEKKDFSEKLSFLFSGKDLAFFEGEKDRLKKEEQDITKLQEKGRLVADSDEKINALKKALEILGEKASRAKEIRIDLIQNKNQKEIALSELEEVKEIEDAIKSLEERRRELVKDLPCPLCGSTIHPFADHVPETGNTQRKIRETRNELKKIQADFQNKEKEISAHETGIKFNEKAIKEEKEKLTDLIREFQELQKSTSFDISPLNRKDLSQNLDSIRETIFTLSGTIKEIKTITGQCDILAGKILEKTRKIFDEKINSEKAGNYKSGLDEKTARLSLELKILEDDFFGQTGKFNSVLAPYKNKSTYKKNNEELIVVLSKRLVLYQTREKNIESLNKKIVPLMEQFAVIKTTIDSDTKQLEKENQDFLTLKKNLDALVIERKNLFGDKDPQKVQDELKHKTLVFEKDLKTIDSALIETKNQLAASEEILKQNKADHERIDKEIEKSFKAFHILLKENGFYDENDFLKAFLPEDMHRQLINKKNELEKRKTQTLSLKKDSQDKLEKTLENPVTIENMEAVLAKALDAEKQKADLSDERGGLRAQLLENEKRVKEHRQKVDDAALQANECKRWDYLNELIGSADGARFRKFAQGLTLETLMEKANTYLELLSRRYVLKRSDRSDLAIEVIDTFYGDQVRPTDNLSGGEGFIVSLSLALGLSDLSSRRTSIESLFLDEGFGTLDAETLETALVALDTLKASGKTIGVISHVEALKERIAAKIEVIPVSGGVSRLEITGG